MATHSIILAWKISWTGESSVLCIVHRVAESDMNEHTHTNKLINFIIRVLIPNSCQEQKSLTFCLTFKLTSYPETVFWIL